MAKFSSDNQPKERKGRGKGTRTVMLEAIKSATGKGEKEFLEAVVEEAVGGNHQLMKLVIERIQPPLPNSRETYNFELDSSASPTIRSNQIVDAVSEGHIPPEVGKMLIDAIGTTAKIEESTDLKHRIEELEKKAKL